MRTRLGRGTPARLILLVILGSALAACAGATSALPAGTSVDTRTNDSAYGGTAEGPMEAASAAPSMAPAAVPAAGGQGVGDVTANDLQIVYTGTLQLVVADVTQALAQAKTAVLAAGGYIGASQESNAGDQPTATITYRIPASKWEDTIAAIRGTSTKVVDQQTQASEIGGQLVDLEARIANLRASEAALQKIAEGAGNVNDLLQVQSQLTDVRGQIEELDAQRARLADQVSYGTLVTTFGVEVQQVKTAAKGWDPASDVDGATAAMISFGQRLVSAAIWFGIVWVPFLLVTAVVLFVGWKLVRRFAPRMIPPAPPTAGWGDGAPMPPTPPQA
jgi:hypothetical protein